MKRSLLNVFGIRTALALFAVCAMSMSAFGQAGNNALPQDFGIKQNLGVKLPLETPFVDEVGKNVLLGDYFKDKPVILALIFYHCNGSCLLVRDGILKTLNAQKVLQAEKDFEVVAISIHPKETPDLARLKKEEWLNDYRYRDDYDKSADGFHFLTGTWENVHKVTDQVGFKFTYDEKSDRVAHAAGIIFVTPQGNVSEYLLGVTYPQKEVHDALIRAKDNKIGPKTETVLWGCLQYDEKSGRYRPVVERILQIAGFSTVIILLGAVLMMSFRYRQHPLTPEDIAKYRSQQETEGKDAS